MKTATENHIQSKRRVWSPVPEDTSTKHSHSYDTRNIVEKGVERLQEPGGPESLQILCVLVIPENTFIKDPKMSEKRTMPKKTGASP